MYGSMEFSLRVMSTFTDAVPCSSRAQPANELLLIKLSVQAYFKRRIEHAPSHTAHVRLLLICYQVAILHTYLWCVCTVEILHRPGSHRE